VKREADEMNPRTRGLIVAMLSMFAGGLTYYLVPASPLRQAAIVGGVTLVVAVILLFILPKSGRK
jgi:membrane protein YdbS with pleckstrin-like domain